MSLNGLLENRYELQELLSLSRGKHTLKFGGRIRAINESNASGDNYNGVFTFNSLDAYRITEAGRLAGLTPAQIRAQGGGASQFAISAMARITQFDVGLFLQDDWKIGRNLTLSGGLCYEAPIVQGLGRNVRTL
jgi:outer membrane receptor protein involved in Fe transport